MLENLSIIAWLQGMKTEDGKKIDLKQGYFMYDIFRDFSPLLAIQKPAQIRATTTQILKVFWGMQRYGINAIYTLPTVADAREMSKSKIGRLISQNPKLQEMVRDMDTVDQKIIGNNMLYVRGTFVEKAAMMFPSDWNLHDEVDSSNQDVIEQYSTRLQHSDYKWQHFFSHPNAGLNTGINKVFKRTDQKHWFVKCERCGKKQFLSWPESVCMERKVYQCKTCKKPLTDENRRVGEWVKRFKGREGSGYQLSLLMCPWVSAEEVIKYHTEKSLEYFTTRVLGLPYVGEGNTVTWDIIRRNLTTEINPQDGRIVIGADTGTTTWYVVGNKRGIFYYGSCSGYDEIEMMMKKWKNSIVVFDGQGDLMKPRELKEKYPGRVFLCFYQNDRKTDEMVRWGKDREAGTVRVDRNRAIQLLVDEFGGQRIPLQIVESEHDWYDYFLHWSNIYRTEKENHLGVPVKKWERDGDDHWVHATVYWRTGISRFHGQMAEFAGGLDLSGIDTNTVEVSLDGEVANPLVQMQEADWDL